MASDHEIHDIDRGSRGDDPREMADRLIRFLKGFDRTVTGFSAGVDSTVVAVAAGMALGEKSIAVTADTETIPGDDLQLARRIAGAFDLRHLEVRYSELEIGGYAENPTNRCYFCKDALYRQLRRVADEIGGAVLLDGTNADDQSDYRPGRQAAREQGVVSPLLELGFRKTDVREIAQWFGLENSDKPSGPCLSSRIPYGTEITQDVLRQVADAESGLRELGFTELRVRHHGDVARIELLPSEFNLAFSSAAQIEERVRKAGYSFVALDLGGFRSGSLNRVLTQIELPAGI